MIYGLGDAIRGGEGDEDIKTAILVLGGGGEVEAAPSPVDISTGFPY